MSRRRKYDLEAIRRASHLDCPHCKADLSASEYIRVDSEQIQCLKCRANFVPPQKGTAMRTS